ncbi:putative monooxygenase [Atractiella rhizophila]|nr:putative monooxygenase [Atractiella rhizophila]
MATDSLRQELRILIIGAGLAGLSTGLALAKLGFSNVQVVEQAKDLGVVGVGIQCAPNMARILDRLRVWDEVKSDGVEFQRMSIRRAATNEVLSEVYMGDNEKKYGFPNHQVAHRASITNAIYSSLKDNHSQQVRFKFAARVESIDFERTTATLDNGETIAADVIISGDGIKSKTRALMVEREGMTDQAVDTGRAAYRLTITREQMEDDPELKALIDNNGVIRWITHERMILCYPIQRHTIFNIVVVHPDINFATADEWTVRGSKADLLKVCHDFCPTVQKMLGRVEEDSVWEWKLRVSAKLKTWVCGNVALSGDACHATLPHLAQGAAQALEDGVALAVCLSKIDSKEDINQALLAYQTMRKSRAELMVDRAAASGQELSKKHSEDRDARFKAAATGGENPDKMADLKVQQWIYSYDVFEDAMANFEKYFKESGLSSGEIEARLS